MTSRHPCMWGAVARAWLVAGIPLALAACGGSDTPPTVPPSEAPVASVSVTAASDTVLLPRTVQLTAVPKDAKGAPLSDRTITWSTSDPAIATVSASGLVTTVALGAVTITATVEGQQGTRELTVAPVLTVGPPTASAFAGDTIQLSVTASDANGAPLTLPAIEWRTSAAGIATVSSAGIVTGVSAGEAMIETTGSGGRGTAAVTILQISHRPNRRIGFIVEVLQPDSSHIPELFTSLPDGSQEQHLTLPGIWVPQYAWSPDGNRIAIFYASSFKTGGVYIINADGSGERLLAAGMQDPEWSPDGQSIAARSYESYGQSSIWVLPVDGGPGRRLTFEDGDEILPHWSPDGHQIAYTRAPLTSPELWVMNSDGTNQHRVPTPTKAEHPRWSPDGKYLAFDGGGGVWLMDARTGQHLRSLSGNCTTAGVCTGGINYWNPAWSRDARKVAMFGNNGYAMIVSLDGAAPVYVPIVNCCPIGVGTPSWSPDGTRLTFDGWRSGMPPQPPGVYVVNADGSGQQFVTGFRNAGAGSWQP